MMKLQKSQKRLAVCFEPPSASSFLTTFALVI